MDRALQNYFPKEGHALRALLFRGIAWGMIGGLAGTLVMDMLLMVILLAFRQPASLCFTIVGDTVSRLLAIFSIDVGKGISTGMTGHYLIGPLVGAFFGGAATNFAAPWVVTPKKCVITAILYVEILSQPILAITPILLKMTSQQILLWFGGSFIMHLLLAIILGTVVHFGLSLAPFTIQRSILRKSCKSLPT
jgi:hypothetical protein